MPLDPGFEAVALKLQEQADLSHNDISRRLQDELQELCDPGEYCYVVDVFGDSASGDVVYSMGGDLQKAPYEITTVNGKTAVTIDTTMVVDVLPRTTYEEEPDEADHMAAMGGMEAAKLYSEAPLYERFITKAERTAADTGSFAGKGKSFPILKPADVMAAVRSMGRAGAGNYDTATLKKRIVNVATKKGWTKYLPKAWRGGKEAAEPLEIEIAGEFIPLKEGAVGQDGTAYLKLIAPGRGSSGYYPEEVLRRDGPKVFPTGTKNFWDHQTEAEETARPEGSLRDLASVLTEDAHYEDAGPAGPGLYAKARVFEQFRKPVDDLAKHIGMSIRAAGKAKEGKAPDGKSGPIIEQLTKGISVDYVTTPGAGGKILQLFEAARSAATTTNEKEVADMDAAEFKKLQESNDGLSKRLETAETINRKLAQRLALAEARDFAEKELSGVRLHESAKARVLNRVLGMAPISEAGELDTAKYKTLIADEAKDEAAYIGKLTEGRVVTGMGAPPPTEPADPKKEAEAFDAEMQRVGKVLGFSEAAAKTFAAGRERGAA